MSPPKAALRAPARTSGFRSGGPNISSSRRTRAAGGSASRRSISGSCTASIRKCRRTSSSTRSRSLIKDGVIRCAGLSEVGVAEIEAASKYFPVATVQNRYNLADRKSEAVLDYCEKHGIGFIPWFPLNAGELAREGSALDEIARRRKATPGPDRARLAAQAQPGHAADSRHRQGRASRGERRRGGDQAVRRGVRDPRPGRARGKLTERAASTTPKAGCVGDAIRVYTRMASICYCASLRAAARKTTALYDAALAPVGINVAQFALLRRIERAQPVSLTEIGRLADLDRSTVGRNVKVLERLGLVRLAAAEDQREAAVTLTPAGAEALLSRRAAVGGGAALCRGRPGRRRRRRPADARQQTLTFFAQLRVSTRNQEVL